MSTPNPWTVVPSSEYERYMGPQGLDQLAPLSAIFQEVYLQVQPDHVIIPGLGTGNGLEHVNPAVTKKVIGVDVNLQYLGVARQRFMGLGPTLELYANDAEHFRTATGVFDLVHAALIFEYVPDEGLVKKIAEWLSPKGLCSVVLDVPGAGGPEPDHKALKIIAKARKLVDPKHLAATFAAHGLALKREKRVALKHGHAFWVGQFGR